MVNPTSRLGLDWDIHILAVLNCPDPEDRPIDLDEVAHFNGNRLDCGYAHHFVIPDSSISIGVITIEVRILIGVTSVVRVDTAEVFPAVWHLVIIGVGIQWAGEVGWPPCVCDLVFLDIVQSVFIIVAVSICGVCRV